MKGIFKQNQLLGYLRNWAVPLFSVATFIPILAAYLASSTPETPKTRSRSGAERSILPPLSQIPAPPKLPEESSIPRQTPINPPKVIEPAKPKAQTLKAVTSKPQRPSSVKYAPKTTKNTPSRQPLTVPANYTPPALEIRVAIVRDVSRVVIGVSDRGVVTDRSGRSLRSITPSEGLSVTPSAESLSMGDFELPSAIFIQPTTKNGLVYVDDRWYRGKVLIVSQGDSLLVVNHVNLEEYLYSVVGSEMHFTASPEALKAQAIAARSYALVHMIRPASPWFSLGNTQRWQVYKGIQSEYNSTHQAVNATAGQILSYKGGVVESLYAATDEIVSWAHGGKGMSQTGAYKLADQGYDYQRILGYYYPGVSLARLVLQQ